MKNFWLDLVERAGWSFGEQLGAVLLASGSIGSVVGLPWLLALSTGAGAFIVSALLTIALNGIGLTTLPVWADILTRAVKTFAASLVALLPVGPFGILNVSWVTYLNLAAVATVLSLTKMMLALASGGTPTTIPAPVAVIVPVAPHVPEHSAGKLGGDDAKDLRGEAPTP